ncbi:unnamed protein product [Diatraea saccharalis]|uniref:MADF domain-containing protein n=1 Tax=Diatraea saccharalis TaxID=40085 RepID=A0A9N9WJ30_9NEOP|nr:unnamed protein product [Diatraea saccharalis]
MYIGGIMRWSEEETIKLIQLYRSFQYLWDKNAELYKNGVMRKRAYDAIVQQMSIPRLTARDVRCKIKNLRSSYYHELRKMEKAGSEKVVGRQWFNAFKPVMGGSGGGVSTSSRKSSVTESESSQDEQDESCFIEEESPNMDAYVVTIKQEYLDEMQNHDEKDIAPVDDYLEVAPKRIRMVESPPEKTHAPAFENPTPKQVTKSKAQGAKLDEFQMFSNNIAAQLRRLPLDRALILQVEVQSLIAKERIRIFKRQSGDNKEEDSS